MNSIGDDIMQMLRAGLAELETNFDAMVIGNQGENFSAGANLMMVLLAAQEEEWDELNAAIHRFQQMNMALKYAPKPVVAAPFGMALGGGCEMPLHCTRIQASAELYMGLVEVGVGLIPAGGGCKEMLLRSRDLKKIFEQIGFAKGFDQRGGSPAFPVSARWRPHFDEPGAADRRCQATGVVAGSRLCAGGAANRHHGIRARKVSR